MPTSAYIRTFQQQTLKAVQNLERLSHRVVPAAGAKAANALRRRVMTESLKSAESESLVEKHHIQRRFPKRLQRPARPGRPAIIHAKLSDIPAIELLRKKGESSSSIRQRAMQIGRASRATPGVTISNRYPRSYPGAFIADGTARVRNPEYNARLMAKYPIKGPVLKGNVQVMRRTGKAAYPLEVIKVPLARAMRRHLRLQSVRLLRSEGQALVNHNLLKEFERHLKRG